MPHWPLLIRVLGDATVAGELFEYWVHEAAHAPVEHYPLWRWKMGGGG